jgi:hypothetical protein
MAGLMLGGFLAVAIGGGALLLRGSAAEHAAEHSPAVVHTTVPPQAAPSTAPQRTGPVTVAGIVRLAPPKGWLVRTHFLTHVPPYLRLVKDQVRMNILAGTFDGSTTALADRYASEFVLPFATGSARMPARSWMKLPSGVVALRLTYSGSFMPDRTAIVHELTVLKEGSHGVVFDEWGAPDAFGAAHADLLRVIDSAVVR